MTEDIWDGKLEPVWVPRGYYSKSKIKEDDVQMIIKDDMDTFHEKLKTQMLEDSEHTDSVIRVLRDSYYHKIGVVRNLLEEWELGTRTAQMNEDARSTLVNVCNQLRKILEGEE